MVSRANVRAMARWALAAMLFAQAAMGFAACESIGRAPAVVIALAERSASGENCHDEGTNLNLCLAHCLGEDQSLDKHIVKVPAFSALVLLHGPTAYVSPRIMSAPRRLTMPHAGAPPPRILFQSLLI